MAETKYVKVTTEVTDEPFFALEVGVDTSMFSEGDIVCLCCGGLAERDEVLMREDVPAGSKAMYEQDCPLVYLFYAYDWVKSRGYEPRDFFEQMKDTESKTIAEAFNEFEERGFNGELYVCYDEFMDDYLGDPEYALAILNDYVEYLTEDEKEVEKHD